MTAEAKNGINRLLIIMAQLRNPQSGCPWDKAQTFETIAPYTLEEAYEVADAIAREDMAALKDELGDLLLQTVFHARIAEEDGMFDFDAVAHAISDKMERRHPHIFDGKTVEDGDAVITNWETIKATERAERAETGVLGGVALALPSLLRAHKLQKRAARVGFDWPDADGARSKIHEELAEVDAATTEQEIEEEIGDLLFSVVNFARKKGVESEAALRLANRKFERRFREVERLAGATLDSFSLKQLEEFWQASKKSKS